MMFPRRVVFVISTAIFISLVLCEKKKLTALQIGIKKRIPAEDCKAAHLWDQLEVMYKGMLYSDGTEFDSNYGRTPFSVTLGSGQVIRGWEKGLLGMCEGEKRRILIPSSDGYGLSGSPPTIPGGADLIFEVELVKLKSMDREL